MDRKLLYCRFELWTKPGEKRPIRREITLFLKVSKMAIFGRKGGTKGKFSKIADFLVELRKAFENFPLVPPLLFGQKWPFSILLEKVLFLV